MANDTLILFLSHPTLLGRCVYGQEGGFVLEQGYPTCGLKFSEIPQPAWMAGELWDLKLTSLKVDKVGHPFYGDKERERQSRGKVTMKWRNISYLYDTTMTCILVSGGGQQVGNVII